LSERQRKTINKESLRELAESITTKGMLHPIVLRPVGEDGKHELVAGERRFRAVTLLHEKTTSFTCDGQLVPTGEVPYTLTTEGAKITLLEMELEENTQRVDLTWQERVAALDELHSLRQAQNPKHSAVDTAKEMTRAEPEKFHAAQKQLQQARLIAPFMDDTAVSGAKNVSTAAKLVARKIEQELNRALAKSSTPFISKHILLRDNLFSLLEIWEQQKLPSLDCIIADPPYGVNADGFGNAAIQSHTYTDTPDDALNAAKAIFYQSFAITKPNAHMYMFCDIELFLRLRTFAADAGWTPFRTPLIWNKVGMAAHAPLGEYGFRRRYEVLLFAAKGKMPFSNLSDDVIDCPPVREKVHAAQKPVELYKKLLALSCIPGMTVLDPCCGSGPIFAAAEALSLTAIGIEQDAESFKLAQDALREAVVVADEVLEDEDEDNEEEDEEALAILQLNNAIAAL
jgi:DNA modification methylase